MNARLAMLVPLLLAAPLATAATLRIDFSGQFYGTCADCIGYDTEQLPGTDFSGYVLLPTVAEPDPEPYFLEGVTLYRLDKGQAKFALDAADDRFDVSTTLNIRATVYDGSDCLSGCMDFVSLLIGTDNYWFELSIRAATPDRVLDGTAIPTLAQLQQLAMADDGSGHISKLFSVGMSSWDGWVGNYDGYSPYNYIPLTVQVSAVPLPPALLLFPAALLMLLRFRRSGSD